MGLGFSGRFPHLVQKHSVHDSRAFRFSKYSLHDSGAGPGYLGLSIMEDLRRFWSAGLTFYTWFRIYIRANY